MFSFCVCDELQKGLFKLIIKDNGTIRTLIFHFDVFQVQLDTICSTDSTLFRPSGFAIGSSKECGKITATDVFGPHQRLAGAVIP